MSVSPGTVRARVGALYSAKFSGVCHADPAGHRHYGRQVVRLALGKFDDVTTYGDPMEQCAAFAAQGAEWIHVVDLGGARGAANAAQSAAPADAMLEGEFSSAAACVSSRMYGAVRWGVSRVVLGSVAVQRAQEVREWTASFGVERLCCALDVRLADGRSTRSRGEGWTAGSGIDLTAALGVSIRVMGTWLGHGYFA